MRIYLPEVLTRLPEKDLYPFEERENSSFCVGFSVNKMVSLETGNHYRDNLNTCLTGITWVESNMCLSHHARNGHKARGEAQYPYYYRVVKTLTLYMDNGGVLQEGNYQETRFHAQRQRKSPQSASDDTIDILDGEVETRTKKFISRGKELHQDIFMDHRLRLEGMEELPLNIESAFYEYLSGASIHNRNMEMSFIYSIAHEEKKRMETLETLISTAALPVEISARPAIKALQTALGLMAYLISVKDKLNLDENMVKYRGPVVISDVYYIEFQNNNRENQNIGGIEWGIPNVYTPLSSSINNPTFKQMELNEFLELDNTLKNEIKNQ